MKTIKELRDHPIHRGFWPYNQQFLSAVWLPASMTVPKLEDIRIAALIGFGHFHCPHLKVIPAFEMMMSDYEAGLYHNKHTIVVDSSGNTAHAVARLAPVFGFIRVKAVLPADAPSIKKQILSVLGPVGLMHPDATQSVQSCAIEEGQKPGHIHLNQYGHPGNLMGHEKYTGPEVLRLLGENAALVAVGMGSGGTAAGIGQYFKFLKGMPTQVLGVRPVLGQQVPGTRDEKRMAAVVTLPWQHYVDHTIEVSRKDSFIAMRRLWQVMVPQVGPSGGLAFCGLVQYLESLASDALKDLRGKTVGFICHDDGRFYSDLVAAELDPDQGL